MIQTNLNICLLPFQIQIMINTVHKYPCQFNRFYLSYTICNQQQQVMEDSIKKNQQNFRTHKLKTYNQSTPTLKSRIDTSLTDWNNVKLQRVPGKQKFKVNEPLRIPIPHFFNVPPHQHPFIINKNRNAEMSIYATTTPIKQLTIPIPFARRIKQLNIMRQAMKRAKELKSEARCDYSLGVIYENLSHYISAEKHYQRFLRIAVYFKDQKSIELIMNTLGIVYMKMNNYTMAIEYHMKQIEISSERNKYIGFINLAKCYYKLGQSIKSMQHLSKAKYLAQQQNDQYRIDFVEELMISQKQKSMFVTQNDERQIQNYYSKEVSHKKNETSPEKLVKSHMRLGDINIKKKEYVLSNAQYAKSIEFAEMKHSPRFKKINKQMMKNIRLGYSISRAENKMSNYLEEIKDSFRLSKNTQ